MSEPQEEPQILSPATCWCSKCYSWIAPSDGKCPKCHTSDLREAYNTLDPKFQLSQAKSLESAPEHGYAIEQPTHDMIIAGVRAWNVWHSVIEVWRQMETVRRYQQQKQKT